MSAEAERKIDELYELFANREPSFGAGTPPRWQVVLDNAIWNKNRIETAYAGIIKVHELVETVADDIGVDNGESSLSSRLDALTEAVNSLVPGLARLVELLEAEDLAR